MTVNQRSFLWTCMTILFLALWSRGVARAQAFSLARFGARRFGAAPSVSTYAKPPLRSSSSDDDESGNEEQEPSETDSVPSTGWNHNLPSKDSSFWKTPNGLRPSTAAATAAGQASRSSNDSREPRTGWLHNTSSKEEKEAKKPDEAQQEDTGLSARRLLNLAKMKQLRNHRIIAPTAFHACGEGRQVVVTEHKLSVPLKRPKGVPDEDLEIVKAGGIVDRSSSRVDVFFTIVEQVDRKKTDELSFWKSLSSLSPMKRADAYVERAGMTHARDMMVYLQGGPGFGAPTPVVSLSFTSDDSWAGKALGHYKRVVLMDQRGTGQSTPITKQTLEKRFPDLFLLDQLDGGTGESLENMAGKHPAEASKVRQALSDATGYMAQFRANNIVQDAEAIKDALLLPQDEGKELPRPWGGALGQSFGGFCMMTYLSQVDHPPQICLLTGGVAPMMTPAYEAYRSLWKRVKERSLQYYDMYPGDVRVIKRIVRALLDEPAPLPSGGKLTARRFLNLGLVLGGSPSAFASLHALISNACLDSEGEKVEFSRAFLKSVDSEQSFDDHPIYFLMHESIYADGSNHSPTKWAAHCAYEELVKMSPEYDYTKTCKLESDDERPTLFFGEMVFPWFADGDFAEVSGLGMKCLAHALAEKDDWGPLYDAEHMRRVLDDGSISRAAAALYLDDMYVDFNEASKVTSRGGPLEKCKLWASNEYQHSGLRDNGAFIFDKLYGMATGSIRTPS